MTEFFLDISFGIPLSATPDQYNDNSPSRALKLAYQIENQGINLITTRPFLLQIINTLSKQKW